MTAPILADEIQPGQRVTFGDHTGVYRVRRISRSSDVCTFDTPGGRSYLQNLQRLHPTEFTKRAVEQARCDAETLVVHAWWRRPRVVAPDTRVWIWR